MNVPYSEISDIRYNSFTGEYTPVRITNEEHIIPSSAPYIITLNESPQRAIPSTIVAVIKETSQTLTEKSKTTTPGTTQYNVNYDELANGQVRVNPVHAGKTLQISYDGLGTLLKKETITPFTSRFINSDVFLEATYKEQIRSFVWDMVSSAFINLTFLDVEVQNVIFCQCWIRKDTTESILYPLEKGASQNDTSRQGYINYATSVTGGTRITMTRKQGGDFDSVDYNSSAIVRGYVYMLYRES